MLLYTKIPSGQAIKLKGEVRSCPHCTHMRVHTYFMREVAYNRGKHTCAGTQMLKRGGSLFSAVHVCVHVCWKLLSNQIPWSSSQEDYRTWLPEVQQSMYHGMKHVSKEVVAILDNPVSIMYWPEEVFVCDITDLFSVHVHVGVCRHVT